MLMMGVSKSLAAVGGVVAFDAVSSQTNGASPATTMSWTHTPVGTPTAVVASVTWYNGNASQTASATYDGVAMTKDYEVDLGANGFYMSCFSLPNPASGAKTLEITFSIISYAAAGALTVTGSDTSQVYRAAVATNSGTGTSSSLTVSSATDDLVVDFGQFGVGSGTPHASQTANWDINGIVGIRNQSSWETGSASVSMDWTLPNADWTMVGGSIKHA